MCIKSQLHLMMIKKYFSPILFALITCTSTIVHAQTREAKGLENIHYTPVNLSKEEKSALSKTVENIHPNFDPAEKWF